MWTCGLCGQFFASSTKLAGHFSRNHKWTEEEDAVIRERFPQGGVKEVRKLLPHRTIHAIQRRARVLKVKFGNYWTEEEDTVIRERFPTEGAKGVQKLLPYRTISAIHQRAQKLKVRFNRNLWTEEEKEILRRHYRKSTKEALQKMLPNRTWAAIQQKAKQLGLSTESFSEEWRELQSLRHKGQHSSPATEFKKGLIPWNKGKKATPVHRMNLSKAKSGIERKLPLKIAELIDEDAMLNYILQNPQEFGYAKVFIARTPDYDLIGIRADGIKERVEVEKSAYQFFYHNHNCDKVIAFYRTKEKLEVPVIYLNRRKFIPFAETLYLLKREVESQNGLRIPIPTRREA